MKVAVITAHENVSPWFPGMEECFPTGTLVTAVFDGADYKVQRQENETYWFIPPCNLEILGDL